MLGFENEEIKPALVSSLIAIAKFSARGDKSIIETYKKAFGNLWESTYLESAISELEKSMLEMLNNNHLIDTFKATSNILKSAYPENPFPTTEEICSVVRFSHDEGKLEVRNYEVVSGLGRNGMFEKVRYRNGTFERFFVRKKCDIDGKNERFQREIGVVARLQHPGLVSIVDAEFTAHHPWYVMDFIEGANLRDYHGEVGNKHDVMLNILNTFSFLHENNIVHGDLKPTNIMVRTIDSQPIIVDFGFAYNQEQTVLDPDITHYSAPEVQADPERRRMPASDIYTCGVIAYELFCNRPPDREHYVSIGVGFEKLDKIVKRAIRFKSADRYQTIGQMRDAWSETRLTPQVVWFQPDMFA